MLATLTLKGYIQSDLGCSCRSENAPGGEYLSSSARVFDHLRFRNRMRDAFGPTGRRLAKATAPKEITLQKPVAISGADEAWFDGFYKPDTQAFHHRVLFST